MFQIPDFPPATADHHVAQSYSNLSQVAALEEYDGRGLPLHVSRPSDIVRVPTKLKPAMQVWAKYVTDELGLKMPQIKYGDVPGQFLNGPNRSRFPIVFKLGEWVVAQRPELGRELAGLHLWEDKTNFLHECGTSDMVKNIVRIPYTYHSRDGGVPEFIGPCWFKPTVGASGNGTKPCETEEGFVELLERFQAAGEDFQIQEHVPGTNLSAQLWILEDGAEVFTTTDQIMGGKHDSEHIGNIYPSSAPETYSIAQTMGDFVYLSGYRGPCGFDYRLHEETGEIYLLEMNARLTGAHYPGAMAGHLGFTRWRHIMVEDVRHGLLRDDPAEFMGHLREHDLLWTKKSQRGVVPWYIGTLGAGKVMLLIPGDRKQQEAKLVDFRLVCC